MGQPPSVGRDRLYPGRKSRAQGTPGRTPHPFHRPRTTATPPKGICARSKSADRAGKTRHPRRAAAMAPATGGIKVELKRPENATPFAASEEPLGGPAWRPGTRACQPLIS